MKRILILLLVVSMVLVSGCSDNKNIPNDGSDLSCKEIYIILSDNYFCEWNSMTRPFSGEKRENCYVLNLEYKDKCGDTK